MCARLQRPLALGIESSCDDTACAVVDGTGRVLRSVVSSQLRQHAPYGGVVPEIASREHLRNWPTVVEETLAPLELAVGDCDLVAATRGPGLVGALLVGLSIGKGLAYALGRPFFAVHHMEGHLFSPFLVGGDEGASPVPQHFLGLIVSGGHSLLLDVRDGGAEIETLAQSRDDAMGEVFDKLGKRLGLGFPAGPLVDRLAERGTAAHHPLPVGNCGDSLDFSFSGLKSRALRDVEALASAGVAVDLDAERPEDGATEVLDLLAGFRAAAVAQLLDRLERRHRARPIDELAVSGGAAANRLLRQDLETWCGAEGIRLRLVPLVYSGDNAAMIAFAALRRHQAGDVGDDFSAEAESRLPF